MIKRKEEILFGLLLGNASLQTYTGGKTWRIRFNQSNADYLFHLYSIFKENVKTPPAVYEDGSGNKRWKFNTTVMDIGLKFSKMFYNKGKKKLPCFLIDNRFLSF